MTQPRYEEHTRLIRFSLDLPQAVRYALPHTVSCMCPGVEMSFPNFTEAGKYAGKLSRKHTPLPGCKDPAFCTMLGLSPDAVLGYEELEVPSGRARLILDALGLGEYSDRGRLDAADFLGRVLLALAIAPHDEGAPEGSLQDQLGTLRDMTEFGARDGYPVRWS